MLLHMRLEKFPSVHFLGKLLGFLFRFKLRFNGPIPSAVRLVLSLKAERSKLTQHGTNLPQNTPRGALRCPDRYSPAARHACGPLDPWRSGCVRSRILFRRRTSPAAPRAAERSET